VSDLTQSVQNGYIQLPVTVDAPTLTDQAIADIQAQLPGYIPYEGQLDVVLLEELALMVSVAANVFAQVPLAIFQYFGTSIMNIPPETGAPAETTVTFTTIDTQGYTIPEGFLVGYAVSGNVLVPFQTVSSLTIAPGSNTGSVLIQSTSNGAVFNGILDSTAIMAQQSVSWILSIVATGPTAGGADPETLTAYLNRLSTQLQLMSPRPILPSDFAAISLNVAGVYRATAVNLYLPSRTVVADLTSGSPDLTVPSGYTFTNDDIGSAVTGTGVPSSTTISSVTGVSLAVMSHNASSNETAVTLTLGALTDVERCVSVSAVDINGNYIDSSEQAALLAYLQALREVNFLVFVIPPTYTDIYVTVVVQADLGQDPTALQASVTAALTALLSQATWGGGADVPPVWDSVDNVVRYLTVASTIGDVPGVAYIATLYTGTSSSPSGTTDITLSGPAALTTLPSGALIVTVTT
jgi:uncharacterized phage protein gp47/JayE